MRKQIAMCPPLSRSTILQGAFGATLLIAQICCPPVATQAEEVIVSVSRLELFVDRYLIDRLDGVQQRLHRPQPANIVIERDQPGGLWIGNGYAVIKDGDTYRLFYNSSNVMALAESSNGVDRTTQTIGLVDYRGTSL